MVNLNELSERDSDLEAFQKWIQDNPALPGEFDNILLQRYLKVFNKSDLKKSQDLLSLNLTIRKRGPHIFTNRDLHSEEVQRALNTVQFCLLPNLTPQGHKVTIVRMVDTDPSQFFYVDLVKAAMMMMDARFTVYDDDEDNIASGEVFIFDGHGTSLRHFINIGSNFSTVQFYMKYLQEALPIRIKNLHFLNYSAIYAKIFSVISPILKSEVLETIHFHKNGNETLHEHVPKEMLPQEYGGNMGPIADIFADNLRMVNTKRDYLMNDDNWKIIK